MDVAKLAGIARAHADETESLRRLAPEVVQAFRTAGVFTMCVPRSAGGPELDARTIMSIVEALSRGDGAAGWCAMIAATTSLLSGYIDEAEAKTVFEGGGVIGGAFAPRGTATPVDGGYLAGGRWPFASGCQHCDWLMGACLIDGDAPRVLIFPAADAEIIDTWNVSGLRGTGSHDIAVRDLFVPTARSVPLAGARPVQQGPLYAFPFFGLLAVVGGAVAIGIARAAIDELVALAGAKTPTGARRTLGERQQIQAHIARAEAAVRSARAFLHEAAADAWALAERSGEIPVEARASLRLAATDATWRCVQAVDMMYTAGGGTSIYETSVLQRCFRDIHAMTQHIMVAPATYELVGRVLLGLETDTSLL